MATLTNTKIKDTYVGLVKTNNNGNISASNQYLTDGLGNISPLSIGTSNIGIGTTSPNAPLTVSGRISQVDLGNSTFVGFEAGLNDDLTTNNNTAFGYQSLKANTTGANNTSIGAGALINNLSGYNNEANGHYSLYSNVSGYNNVANGSASLFNNTTGYNNIANGRFAGMYISGRGRNTNSNNSTFLGYNTSALADNQTNQIVIGADAIGVGSNSVVLGNDSIATTVLRGNVGIGTTSPAANLDIRSGTPILSVKATTASSSATLELIGLGSNGTSSASTKIQAIPEGYSASATLAFSTRESSGSITEKMRITSTGNVGIGTTNPSKKLHILSSENEVAYFQGSGTSAWINIKGSSSELWSIGADSNSFGVYNRTDSAYRLVVNNAGNVGIGTTSPSYKLDVNGTGRFTELYTQNYQGTAFSTSNLVFGTQHSGGLASGTGQAGIKHISYDNLIFGRMAGLAFYTSTMDAAASEKMRISDGGNVGIGTTSPTSKLQVTGLPSYADNATALAGGLTVGAFYHTAGVLKVVI